jgi:hypothetical protein
MSAQEPRSPRNVVHHHSSERDVERRPMPERDFERHRGILLKDPKRQDSPFHERRIASPAENVRQRRRDDDDMGSIEERKS